MSARSDDSKKDDSRERDAGWANLRARHCAIRLGPRPAVGLRRVDSHHREVQRKRRGKRRLRDHRDERSRERSGIKGWWSKRCWHRNGGSARDVFSWSVVPLPARAIVSMLIVFTAFYDYNTVRWRGPNNIAELANHPKSTARRWGPVHEYL